MSGICGSGLWSRRAETSGVLPLFIKATNMCLSVETKSLSMWVSLRSVLFLLPSREAQVSGSALATVLSHPPLSAYSSARGLRHESETPLEPRSPRSTLESASEICSLGLWTPEMRGVCMTAMCDITQLGVQV